MTDISDYEAICFLIMPFSKKKVGEREVDFDNIYKNIFEPAVAKAETPEGKPLIAKRTDSDVFSSSITQDMFEYILYSRLALTDISGSNPNVLYELGARHAMQEAGTVILRQKGHAIPFDINTIKIFEYEYDTAEQVTAAQDFVATLLTETLKRNRLDSPIRQALRGQWTRQDRPTERDKPDVPEDVRLRVEVRQQLNLDVLFRDAEDALRTRDLPVARTIYRIILRLEPGNIIARMRLGLILKDEGRLFEALEEFAFLVRMKPDYSEAWREKGVCESLIHREFPKDKRPSWAPSGADSLMRATTINEKDADAWSSWGGVLRRVPDEAAALEKYRKAAEVSDGHPYPLLNAIKLEAKLTKKIDIEGRKELLEKAEEMRRGQTLAVPPTDAPWCFFDLAELQLYQEKSDAFLQTIRNGLKENVWPWQIQSFRDSLVETLVKSEIDLPGLSDGVHLLDEALASGPAAAG
jgi:hypothetical protein